MFYERKEPMNKGGSGSYLGTGESAVSYCFNHIFSNINNALKLCIFHWHYKDGNNLEVSPKGINCPLFTQLKRN